MTSKINKNLCPNCQLKWQGKYCVNCGEQKLSRTESSFMELIKQLFSSITEVDNKFINSFRLLIFKPGQLTKDYFAGIRKSRLSPFQVFIFANIIYFFMTGIFSQATFTTPLKYHINSSNFIHQEIAADMVDKKLVESNVSYQDYESKFNRIAKTQSKTLIFVFVPILSLFLLPLFLNKKVKMVRHIVFSTHFMAYLLLVTIVAIPIIQFVLSLLLQFNLISVMEKQYEFIFSLSLFLIYWLYLFLSFKRIYSEHMAFLLIKSIVLTVLVYVGLLIYRMFLFFTAFVVAE